MLTTLAGYVGLRGAFDLRALRAVGLSVLNELIPTKLLALRTYDDWILSCKALPKAKVNEEVANEAIERRRYRQETLRIFQGLGPRAGPVWSLFWKCLPPMVRRRMWKVLVESTLLDGKDEDKVQQKLKELSAIAKKNRELVFGEDWKYYVDLQLLRDYLPNAEISQFEYDIERWVTGSVEHKLDGSEAVFLERFERGVQLFVDLAPAKLQNFTWLTPTEWAADPGNWARSGASDGDRLHLVINGKVKKARKSKWASALAMEKSEVMKMLYSWKKQRNVAIQKRELGKIRAVIAGDLELYLKMSYVGYFIEAVLAGHPNSTLFMTAEQQYSLWTQMAESTQDDNAKIPIDQSEFDHSINFKMISITNTKIRYLIQRFGGKIKPYLLDIMDRIEYALDGGTIRVGNRVFYYEKGVLSGWRWTALYDTMINAGELGAARETVKARSGVDPVLPGWNVQGDDVKTECPNYTMAVLLWQAYEEMDFDVNPGKFFITMDTNEYLRQVAWKKQICGYPARAIPAMVWRNPVSRELKRGEERIREQISSWNQIFNRMGHANWKIAISDVASSNKIPKSMVEDILSTPAAAGGLGLQLSNPSVWRGITKSRANPKFKFLRQPPLARSLAMDWPVTHDELTDIWSGNIELPPKTPIDYEPFEITEQQKQVPILWPGSAGLKVDCPLEMITDQRIPPSVATVLRTRAVRDKDYELVDRIIRPEQRPFNYILSSSAITRRVYWDWVAGALPFKTPIVPGWSSLATSWQYRRFASQMWAWCLGRRRLSYSTVRRAAYSAELLTSETLTKK